MAAFNTEDLKTEINTILQKSGEQMDANNLTPDQSSQRRSILKTPTTAFKETGNRLITDFLNQSSHTELIPMPHNLKDFTNKRDLKEDVETQSSCTVEVLDKDDDIYLVDIPRTVDPMQLKGQVLNLSDKSKFKIGEDRYSAINRDIKSSLTGVFNTNKKSRTYKAVNVKSAGTISIRRKLSGISKKNVQYEKSKGVPFPKNLKIRHPFFGVQVDKHIIKQEKC